MKNIRERPALSQNIVERRSALGLSQEGLAEKAGIGVSVLKNIERGSSAGQPKTRHAIARALGCSVADLLRDPGTFASIRIDLTPEESLRAELLLLVSSLSGPELRDAVALFRRIFPGKR